MAWNPSVVSGIGVVQDVDELYNDMHSYLASSGMSCKSCAEACVKLLSPGNVCIHTLVHMCACSACLQVWHAADLSCLDDMQALAVLK